MTKRSVSVLCTCCGLVSRRPAAFVRARRNFICGGCKELIPLDRRTVREDGALGSTKTATAAASESDRWSIG